MDIEEFKKKYKPKKVSELKKFEVKILELANNGFSQSDICEFLKSNGINTTQPNICKFIKKHSTSKYITTSKTLNSTPKGEEKIKETAEVVPIKQSGLLKQSVVKNYEIVEPDFSKIKY